MQEFIEQLSVGHHNFTCSCLTKMGATFHELEIQQGRAHACSLDLPLGSFSSATARISYSSVLVLLIILVARPRYNDGSLTRMVCARDTKSSSLAPCHRTCISLDLVFCCGSRLVVFTSPPPYSGMFSMRRCPRNGETRVAIAYLPSNSMFDRAWRCLAQARCVI